MFPETCALTDSPRRVPSSLTSPFANLSHTLTPGVTQSAIENDNDDDTKENPKRKHDPMIPREYASISRHQPKPLVCIDQPCTISEPSYFASFELHPNTATSDSEQLLASAVPHSRWDPASLSLSLMKVVLILINKAEAAEPLHIPGAGIHSRGIVTLFYKFRVSLINHHASTTLTNSFLRRRGCLCSRSSISRPFVFLTGRDQLQQRVEGSVRSFGKSCCQIRYPPVVGVGVLLKWNRCSEISLLADT